jgi:hypothetical protein
MQHVPAPVEIERAVFDSRVILLEQFRFARIIFAARVLVEPFGGQLFKAFGGKIKRGSRLVSERLI